MRTITILSLLLVVLCSAANAQDTLHIQKAISGTTVQTATGQTITLLGITTPISRAISAADAKAHLEYLTAGKEAILVLDTVAGPGKGKVLQGYLYVGGVLVNLKMIEGGYAAATKKPAHSMLATFQDAEKAARASTVGAWATERASAVQCSGTTKKGSQCSRMTTNLSGRCWQH